MIKINTQKLDDNQLHGRLFLNLRYPWNYFCPQRIFVSFLGINCSRTNGQDLNPQNNGFPIFAHAPCLSLTAVISWFWPASGSANFTSSQESNMMRDTSPVVSIEWENSSRAARAGTLKKKKKTVFLKLFSPPFPFSDSFLLSVLRIRDILVWIRIRGIRNSD